MPMHDLKILNRKIGLRRSMKSENIELPGTRSMFVADFAVRPRLQQHALGWIYFLFIHAQEHGPSPHVAAVQVHFRCRFPGAPKLPLEIWAVFCKIAKLSLSTSKTDRRSRVAASCVLRSRTAFLHFCHDK